ncbi:integrase core domain-containing protein [Haematobacter missouriensis]|uniref:integrase core domain-containing protein n=1 Tax=Haematobacter missouriensis TaxID=366616 RepID=UPI003CC82F7A
MRPRSRTPVSVARSRPSPGQTGRSAAGTRISMDGEGRCIDNVFIQILWRSLRYECVYLHAWQTGSQAKAAIGYCITFYNHRRPNTAMVRCLPLWSTSTKSKPTSGHRQ